MWRLPCWILQAQKSLETRSRKVAKEDRHSTLFSTSRGVIWPFATRRIFNAFVLGEEIIWRKTEPAVTQSERPAILMARDARTSAKQAEHHRATSSLALRHWPASARPCNARDVRSPPVAGAALRPLTLNRFYIFDMTCSVDVM